MARTGARYQAGQRYKAVTLNVVGGRRVNKGDLGKDVAVIKNYNTKRGSRTTRRALYAEGVRQGRRAGPISPGGGGQSSSYRAGYERGAATPKGFRAAADRYRRDRLGRFA